MGRKAATAATNIPLVLRLAFSLLGRKVGPKTAKPQRNTPKNRKPHQIIYRIPKPHMEATIFPQSTNEETLLYINFSIN